MITDIKYLESQFSDESTSELEIGETDEESLCEGFKEFINFKFNDYVKKQTAKRALTKHTLNSDLDKGSSSNYKDNNRSNGLYKSTPQYYQYEPNTSLEEEKAYEMFIKDACKVILPKLTSIIKSNPAEAGTYTIPNVNEVIERESKEDGFIKCGYASNSSISLGDFSIYNHKAVKSKKVNARSTELWDNSGEFYRTINRINDLVIDAIDKSGFGKGIIDGDWDGNDICLIPDENKVQWYINKYAPKIESAIKDITNEFNAFMESQFSDELSEELNKSDEENDVNVDAVIAEIMNREATTFTNTFDIGRDLINEAMLKSAKDIYHNKDKFKSGETNLCFITGLSGSGKSSMGTAMVKGAKNIEHYDMDDIVFNKQNHDMNYYKNYGDLVYKFFSGPGQKYFVTFKEIRSSLNTSEDKYRNEVTNAFVDFAISYAKSHKNTKFIVEGVWLYRYVSPNKLKDYAVCIKGTSAATSMMRAAKRDNDYIGKFKKGTVWVGDEMKLNKYRSFYKDSTDEEETVRESRTIFGSVDNMELMYMSCYEAYLYNTINNESRLTEALINECGLHESTIMLEADLKQEAKSKWETFINFINRLIDRFNVAMDKILYGKIQYLEDNKNVILNTPWRDDIPYEYEGDYDEAVDRVMNTKCPVFNYERDAKSLRQEGYTEAITVFMAGAGFKYTDDKDIKMEEQFKNYFLAKDHGKKNGKLSDLKPQKLYNFCYNRAKIDAVVKADSSALTQSTNIILNAINKERRERGEDVTKPSNTDSQASVTGNGGSTTDNNKSGNATPATGTTNTQQNISDSFLWISINEDGEQQPSPTGNPSTQSSSDNQSDGNKESSSGKTGLTIGNNSPVADDKGTEDNKTDKNDTTKQDIDNILTKWTTLCRCLITSKLTAVQQISHDYMALITAHVNSVNTQPTNADNKKQGNEQSQDNNVKVKQDQTNRQEEKK